MQHRLIERMEAMNIARGSTATVVQKQGSGKQLALMTVSRAWHALLQQLSRTALAGDVSTTEAFDCIGRKQVFLYTHRPAQDF